MIRHSPKVESCHQQSLNDPQTYQIHQYRTRFQHKKSTIASLYSFIDEKLFVQAFWDKKHNPSVCNETNKFTHVSLIRWTRYHIYIYRLLGNMKQERAVLLVILVIFELLRDFIECAYWRNTNFLNLFRNEFCLIFFFSGKLFHI